MKDSLPVSRSGENLSVIACAMPPPLPRGGFGSPRKVNGFAKGGAFFSFTPKPA